MKKIYLYVWMVYKIFIEFNKPILFWKQKIKFNSGVGFEKIEIFEIN